MIKGRQIMDIIAKLEKYRLENKIPQQELAIKLGVAFSTVNRWLNRKAKPNKIQSYHIEKLMHKKIIIGELSQKIKSEVSNDRRIICG